MSRFYVGIKDGLDRVVFKSETIPVKRTAECDYLAVIGPFRTKRSARFMADHGRNNPHLQCVADAERLAR